MPQNVHLLTLEPWKDNSILIRFEHILETNEDPEYSKPVSFNFKDVFRSFAVDDIRETTLAANQWIGDSVRLQFAANDTEQFKSDDKQNEIVAEDGERAKREIRLNPEVSAPQDRNRSNKKFDDGDDPFTITLKPMEIRTFVVTLEWSP